MLTVLYLINLKGIMREKLQKSNSNVKEMKIKQAVVRYNSLAAYCSLGFYS